MKIKSTYLSDKNKEKSELNSNTNKRFISNESGAIAISFLLMLPFILSFLALAIDGSRIIMKTNRLNRVLNETAIAVATNRLADKLEITDEDEKAAINKTLLKDFVVAHFPDDELKSYGVASEEVISDDESTTTNYYTLTAKIKVNTLLPLEGLPSFDPEIEISNGGRVKQTTSSQTVPTDFAFVLDFSTSMEEGYVQLSDGSKITRIALLKQVLADILPTALAMNEDNKITLIPYTIGVAEKLPGTNPAGGERVGCTVLNASTEDNYNINHTFWSRMASRSSYTYPSTNSAVEINAAKILWGETLSPITFTAIGDYSREVVMLDFFRYEYYRNYVAVATGYSFDKMVQLGWCTDNQGTDYGKVVPYSCAQSYETKITSEEGQEIIANEYSKFINYSQTYPNLPAIMKSYPDIPYVLEHLFDDDSDSLVTFEMEWVPLNSPTYPSNSILYHCAQSGLASQRSFSIRTVTSKEVLDANTKAYFPNVELQAYMIDLTNNISTLNEVQNMTANGNTDSNTGLLRAAQELKKGTNKRKVIIVISDGTDTPYNTLTKSMHKTYSVCSKIREGLIANSPGTEEVLFYFIATVDNLGTAMTMWSTYCTDVDLASSEGSHTMLATNYTTLSNALLSIVTEQSETGSFAVD